MNQRSHKLREVVELNYQTLNNITEEQASLKFNPEKWSIKEILGHLIDSAVNNNRRFVLAQNMDSLIFKGYNQDYWVKIQNYQHRKWREIIELWRTINNHLAYVVDNIGDEIFSKKYDHHNYHEITFKPLPADQEATLSYLYTDYIAHMEHHIKQIFKQV